MRTLIKIPLLSLFCLLAIEMVSPTLSFAGSRGNIPPDSGAGGVSDTFSQPTSVVNEINREFYDLLQEIRTQQSVSIVNGRNLPVSATVFETLVRALTLGSGSSRLGVDPMPSGGSFTEGNVGLPGGSAGQNGGNTGAGVVAGRNKPGGNVFTLRSPRQGSQGSQATQATRRNAHSRATPQPGLSDQALAAVSALEQQILAETGLMIDIDILSISERNYKTAVEASNRIVRQLNSEQLAAVFESPTFIALLKLLGNVDFDDRNEEALLLSIEGSGLGLPWMSLRDVASGAQ